MKRRYLLQFGASLGAVAAATGSIKRAVAQAVKDTKDALGGMPPDVRAKYLAEVEARKNQPIQPRLPKEMTKDPWSKPIDRKPVTEDVDVLIVGTGWAGILSAVRLVQQGITNIRLIDKSGDFGGTWYWNRYPGAGVDDMTVIYMPLLEETGYIPTMKYSLQWEIFEQAQRIGKKYDLYKKTLFQTRLNGITWNEKTSRWETDTDRGDKIRARFTITGTGPIDTAKLPGIPGVETFAGAKWHTSRWNYDYTGGDNKGGLAKLKDKRVAVIGTGATGVQVIPHLGNSAKQLYVLQRTPSDTDRRNNAPIPRDLGEKAGPGWQQRLILAFGYGTTQDLPSPLKELFADDGFTRPQILQQELKAKHPEMTAAQIADITQFQVMEDIRQHIGSVVKDPKTAEALKPYYRRGCKRATFSDTFYETFNKPNVQLLASAQGAEKITPKGFVFEGKEYEVDAIVYASGFEFTTPLVSRQGFDPIGKGGLRLSEYWKDGALTYHGIHVRNFPNLFIQSNLQFGVGGNHSQQSDYSAQIFAYMIKQAMDQKLKTLEPSQEAEDKWVNLIVTGGAQDTTSTYVSQIAGASNAIPCPGATRGAGEAPVPEIVEKRNGSLRGGLNQAMKILNEWRDKGGMEGLDRTTLNV